VLVRVIPFSIINVPFENVRNRELFGSEANVVALLEANLNIVDRVGSVELNMRSELGA
jgi:hypothetical protein